MVTHINAKNEPSKSSYETIVCKQRITSGVPQCTDFPFRLIAYYNELYLAAMIGHFLYENVIISLY